MTEKKKLDLDWTSEDDEIISSVRAEVFKNNPECTTDPKHLAVLSLPGPPRAVREARRREFEAYRSQSKRTVD